MSDYIIQMTAANGLIRAYGADTRETINTAHKIHKTSPVVTAALGRLMTATLLMGSMLKGDEIVTCRITCEGEIHGLIATANSRGEVKGYPHNPIVDIPLNENGKLNVAGAIGEGYLNVSKDLGLKEPYAGQTPLVSGEIAEDFAQYYLKSEQTPSAVALGVLVDVDYTVKRAGGIIIQLLPGATDKIADTLTERLEKMPALTSMLEEGKTIEQILDSIFYDLEPVINAKIPACFKCGCTKEKLYSVVAALGKNEIEDILEKEKKAVLRCHFCNSEYLFDENELNSILTNSCD